MPYRAVILAKISKWLFIFLFSIPVSYVLEMVDKYIYDDWGFLCFLSTLIAIDSVFGFWLAWERHDINIAGFGKLIKKLAIYAAFLILTHGITHFTIHGKANDYFQWFTNLAYTCLMVKEALSIMINGNKLKPGLFPTWIMKRFTDFDNKGLPINTEKSDK